MEQKKYSFQNPQKFNINLNYNQNNISSSLAHNISQKEQYNNNNININKESYLYLHSKKFINKTPSNRNINNNIENDYTEPKPQIYKELNLNIKNDNNQNLFEGIYPKINYNTNYNFSNQTKNNKKLLEEYFKLKNDSNNYNTYNNNIKLSITNDYNKFPKGNQYQPLLNKKKIHQKHNEIKNNTNKNINFKKEVSYKRGELMAQIYQPDKNINYSPSFTPIKYNKNLKNNSKNKESPHFDSKPKSKSNSNIQIDLPKRIKHSNINSDKIVTSDESNLQIKSILKNKNYQFQKEKNNKKNYKINAPTTPITLRKKKNLTPSRGAGTGYDFKKNQLKNEKKYSLLTNLTSTSYNNISSINSTEPYWKRKEYEKNKKLEKIKTERMLKEEKEIQEKPKINYNSKKIMGKKYNNKTDVFERLSDISQIQNHNEQIKRIRDQFKESHTPLINSNSRRMKRTIDDLYKWKSKNERKKIESSKKLNKMMNNNKFLINPQSEEILKEKKSDYINKKVEDRLLEQGRMMQYKNEIQREQYLNHISKSHKYVNNEYMNIHSRYLESPDISKDNIQKSNKSSDRVIRKDNRVKYKTISLRNNINDDESFDYNNDNNSFLKSEMNYMNNNINNMNQNKKEIFLNNNGNNLINGNVNNYIINNNFNNNYMMKPQKNQMEIIDNIKNNHYQYFPDYNSNRDINFNSSQNINNNYEENKQKKYINKIKYEAKNAINNNKNLQRKSDNKLIDNSGISNNFNLYNHTNNRTSENYIINMRKHLNEFYENKAKNKANNESIKNDLLKGLLNSNDKNNDINNNNEKISNGHDKIIQKSNNYNTNYDLNSNIYQPSKKINTNPNYNNNDYNAVQASNNIINENNRKYNFKPELLKDIHKIPKSSGLNFNQNKTKNINYFQFEFDKNNANDYNNEENINENNVQKPYEYIINNNNNKKELKSDINMNDNNIQSKNDKYTIQDSININNFASNRNEVNNINSNYNNNFYDKEKERRKQDLLQMINFSSNLKIGSTSNNTNKHNNINNTNNIKDYENYNIIQSYQDS